MSRPLMITTAAFKYSMCLSIADVVVSPRVARTSWRAIKVYQLGKQEGSI
jgi:hypothetical protein